MSLKNNIINPSEIPKIPSNINHVGLLNVVIEDFNSHSLNRLNTLNTKVNNGKRLNEVDVGFMKELIDSASRLLTLLTCHKELYDFCSYVAALYKDITSKALYNESRINS